MSEAATAGDETAASGGAVDCFSAGTGVAARRPRRRRPGRS